MNSYMTFQPTGGSSKKFAVTFENFLAGRGPNKVITRKPNGAANVQVGASFKVWQMIASIQTTPATGYAGLSDVEGWFSSQTLNGSVGVLTDHNGNACTVALKNEFTPQSLDPLLTRYIVPMIFEQIA